MIYILQTLLYNIYRAPRQALVYDDRQSKSEVKVIKEKKSRSKSKLLFYIKDIYIIIYKCNNPRVAAAKNSNLDELGATQYKLPRVQRVYILGDDG